MPFLNEVGLQKFWENCKEWFADKLGVVSSEDTVTIQLKAADDDGTVLASGDLPVATASNAGLMSNEDKAKLNGIANNATANIGTISQIRTTNPIIGGTVSSGVATISHATAGSSGSVGPSANATPSFGQTFNVPRITTNSYGHVTSKNSYTVKVPDNTATSSVKGLMSNSDKAKLDGIEAGATASNGTITGITTSSPLSGSGTSGTVNISHATTGVPRGSYGPTSTETKQLNFGDTFKNAGSYVDLTGHLLLSYEQTLTLPTAEATTSASGLMSAEDKQILNSLNPSTSTPAKVSANSSVGTGTAFARNDHVHGIDVITGDSAGQIKVAGVNAQVRGWGNFATLDSNNKVPAANLPSTYGSSTYYATCNTSAGASTKLANTIEQHYMTTGPVEGDVVYVLFSVGNSYLGNALQIRFDSNASTTKAVWVNNAQTSSTTYKLILPNNSFVGFRYTRNSASTTTDFHWEVISIEQFAESFTFTNQYLTLVGTGGSYATIAGQLVLGSNGMELDNSSNKPVFGVVPKSSGSNSPYCYLAGYPNSTTFPSSNYGDWSMTEGYQCKASGTGSHAEGTLTLAGGPYSHAEGSNTRAGGSSSHAEGDNSTADGQYSHAQNLGTKATSTAQTAIGKYNIDDTNNTYALIIGNGTSNSSRSNALTVDWNGGVAKQINYIEMYLGTSNISVNTSASYAKTYLTFNTTPKTQYGNSSIFEVTNSSTITIKQAGYYRIGGRITVNNTCYGYIVFNNTTSSEDIGEAVNVYSSTAYQTRALSSVVRYAPVGSTIKMAVGSSAAITGLMVGANTLTLLCIEKIG